MFLLFSLVCAVRQTGSRGGRLGAPGRPEELGKPGKGGAGKKAGRERKMQTAIFCHSVIE